MIKNLQVFLFILISGTALFGQTDFNISGYAFNMPIYQPSRDLVIFKLDDQFYNLSRVRLRPTVYLSETTRLNLEYEINSLYMSETNFSLFDLTTDSNRRQLVKMNWKLINKNQFIVNHFIDRIYIRQGFDWGNVIIGRQRISWGTGRIWNPMDLFNPINPANFYKIEKDGADAVSTMIYLGNFTDLNIVYNFREDMSKSNFGARFRTNFDQYDFSIMSGYFDQRYVIGLDFAGNLFDAGIRGEGIYSVYNENASDNFIKYILGADYQFTSKLYGLIEYHFNGEGKKDKMNYELFRLANGEILNLSQNYFITNINYQLHSLLSTSVAFNINLNDQSGYYGLFGNYSLTEDFYFSLGAQISFGDNFTEYWYYGDSYYLQGEYYF
ncbi:MAG: hypothetical protein K9J16_00920 [Melioribacteraceae bacterium]|nr:hypothetical protein [Melioribacteraceae bacterium]MCF8354031.1 hypothetical protein [Melioribacteraceae bacterium]MCF8392288.1 hypothetical protein [Melioribacteraceae bacterium]MCF8417620.1 hypothetical protein [Melioribacteraceae bacterium]